MLSGYVMEHWTSDGRDLELVMLGILLGSQTLAGRVLPSLATDRLAEKDVAAVLAEIKAGGVGETTRKWLSCRGVAVNGSVVESVLTAVKKSQRRRSLEVTLAQLAFENRLGGASDETLARLIEEMKP